MHEQLTVTVTATCELGRHDRCRGIVLSLTDGHLSRCECPVCEHVERDGDGAR
jgi:hypothetical protein